MNHPVVRGPDLVVDILCARAERHGKKSDALFGRDIKEKTAYIFIWSLVLIKLNAYYYKCVKGGGLHDMICYV